MKYSHTLIKCSIFFALSMLIFGSCVPLRKQIAFSDKEKHTLKKKQLMDTTVKTLPYEYRIRKGDVLLC